MSTLKSNFKKHKYAGSVNRKRVRAMLQNKHGEESKSRDLAWRHQQNRDFEEVVTVVAQEAESDVTRTFVEVAELPNKADLNISGPSEPKKVKTYERPKTRYRLDPITEFSVVDNEFFCIEDSIEEHQLVIEKDINENDYLSGLSGKRVVDIKHVLKWAFNIGNHKKICTCAQISFVSEQRRGLHSIFNFKCNTCGYVFRESNEKENTINQSFVWGSVTSGSFYSQSEHIFSILDIPSMGFTTFKKIENNLGKVWQDHLTEQILEAGKKEKAIAMAKGNIDSDGIPFITVCVDGGWPKRTYGHNFDSPSGMACIIGQETKKCLFLGVKNKYCFYCQWHQNKNQEIPTHQCFKNFDGPSTSMESAILVEGFQKSEDMHGLRYLAFIGDGDSSVFAQLKEQVPYGRAIKKYECKNHVIKNYTNALYKILGNTKLPLAGRNILKQKLTKLTVVTRKIIGHNVDNQNKMKKDLKNGPYHVFGKHEACENYYCTVKTSPLADNSAKQEDLVEKIKKEATMVWALILAANECVIAKAGRLSNYTTNMAENFMSIINKFNCGKRLNLCKRGSYQHRVQIAGLQQVSGHNWHTDAWKKSSSHLPGYHCKTYLAKREKMRLRQQTHVRKRIFTSKKLSKPADKHYGPTAMDVLDNIDPQEIKRLCHEKLLELQKTISEIKEIEFATIGQHENDLYNLHRSDRLTASHFGMVCKRKKKTPCHNHVKQILYKNNFSSQDTAYGHQNESVARTMFSINYDKVVRPAGLFIDHRYGFLGASPDGVIETENAIVEIKCFPSLARNGQDVQTAAKDKKNFPLCYVEGTLQINKKHNFYYQVQGQLYVTNYTKYYLVCFVSTMHPITVIEVNRDENFINNMVTKLKTFYELFVLPEVVMRRVPKNAKCFEPNGDDVVF